MTHIRRPNRKPARYEAPPQRPDLCPASGGKVRYLDEHGAQSALTHLRGRDAEPERLRAYRCMRCRDWHVGHLA